MKRMSTVAVIAAAGGVLVAGTVAGVAIVNAANTHPVAEEVVLVADVLPQPVAAPSFAPSDLPEVVLPTAQPVAVATQPTTTKAGAQPQAVSAAKPAVTRVQARAAVLAQAPGDVLSVHLKSHNGYDAYAVKVQRTDGSVVVGYVDAASGVVFDWKEISGPTPVVQATSDSSGHESESSESSDDSTDDSDSHDHDSDDD